mgnify:CR=1 FL=1
MSEKTLYKTSYWLKSTDQEIVQFVTGIETEEHEISPLWLSKYSVDTNREIDKLKEAVMGAIYAFKSRAIQSRIDAIRKELEIVESENMERINDLISEQIILERVKQSIAVKLGRIITH